jgi:putative Mg2+ transporter-C (MgtC) family protein
MMSALGDLFAVPDPAQLLRVTVQLAMAALLGGVLGFEREQVKKAAGLRTHMLVSLGAALFTITAVDAGMAVADLSRVFQGIAAGIGFIGAGAILKLTNEREIKGLTTAASLWLTAAAGTAVGAGHLWIPIVGVLLAFVVLSAFGRIERWIER